MNGKIDSPVTPQVGTNVKILQIIPATGWFARYIDPSAEDPDNLTALVCWALVEDETGERRVVGMDSASDGVAVAEDLTNFSEYVHTSEIEGETWYNKYQELVAKVEADQKSH